MVSQILLHLRQFGVGELIVIINFIFIFLYNYSLDHQFRHRKEGDRHYWYENKNSFQVDLKNNYNVYFPLECLKIAIVDMMVINAN